jgi:uncharacterized protein YjbI with pentapeptide repeats
MKAFENKEKLIKVLKTNINLWNRYQLIVAIKLVFKIDLSYADLRYANLSSADLRSADLSYADLSSADLSYADLSSADLSYADLDFSSWSFSCKTLSIAKTDIKLRIQLCFHFLKLIENENRPTKEEKEIYKVAKNYANKFHRTELPRLTDKY